MARQSFMKVVFLGMAIFMSGISMAQNGGLVKLLDSAVGLQAKGDKEGLTKVLETAASGVEQEAKQSKGVFSDKLIGQAAGLKKLIPLASKGLLQKANLEKIISTVKLLLGANKISGLLGGSLTGQASTLKSSLGLIQTGMSALGGGAGQKLGPLVTSALGSVGQLEKGGITAKATEPALKKQLGGITDMLKGLL